MKNEIKLMQWPTDDEIFKHISFENFTKEGIKRLKNLQISVIRAAEVITNNEMKQNLIREYHENPIFGSHMDQKKSI